MHGRPKITAPFTVKNFFRVGQPIEVLTGEPKTECAVQAPAIDRDLSLSPKFSSLFNYDVLDVNLWVTPGKTERTII